MPKLVVVLGAGASYDVCPDDGPINRADLRPPVLANLFSRPFDDTLARYPSAQSIMSTVRTEMRGRGATKFEEVLRGLFDNPNGFIRRQIKSVPLALHHFFYEVSTAFTTEPINYSHLVNRTIGQGIHTAFVTLNYDTLLETSLRKIAGVRFSNPGAYISMPDIWLLAKLHGSADWGYPWLKAGTNGLPSIREAIEQLDPPRADPDRIEVDIPLALAKADQWYYPALALPVVGKFGFVSPSSHVDALRKFVTGCQNYLFIGFSANDDDLLAFLNENVRAARRVRIVTGTRDDLRAVGERLLNGVPQFRTTYLEEHHGFGDGFTEYLEGPFDKMVESLLTDGADMSQ